MTDIKITTGYCGYITYSLYVDGYLLEWANVYKLYRDSEFYHTIDPETKHIISLREDEIVDYLKKLEYREPTNFGLIPSWTRKEK
jgi:hypothetical protein